MNWFPQAKAATEINTYDSGHGFSADQIFELAHDPLAREMRERVGVVSPLDGSAKSSCRLLVSRDWIFKTDLERRFSDVLAANAWIQNMIALQNSLGVWHPAKQWFSIQESGAWLAVSICPQLLTLRQLPTASERREKWTEMISFALEVFNRSAVCLDINPANFGIESEFNRLYYLDDEVIGGPITPDYLASAVVSRITEEPGIPLNDWKKWGTDLVSIFPPHRQAFSAQNMFLEILDYPLAPALEPAREQLLAGLAEKARFQSPRGHHRARRTLIFGDVHGNYPALKQVLRKASGLNVDSYLFLGDVVGYGPFPRECIETIRELKNGVFIKGNHDHIVGSGELDPDTNRVARETHAWTIAELGGEERQWLTEMVEEYRTPNFLAVHGSPIDPYHFYAYVYELTYRDNLEYMAENQIPLCFYGHTHVQFVHTLESDLTISKAHRSRLRLTSSQRAVLVNPGSVGQPRDGDPRAAFAIWDHEKNRINFHRTTYPLQAMQAAIAKAGFAEDLAGRLTLGR